MNILIPVFAILIILVGFMLFRTLRLQKKPDGIARAEKPAVNRDTIAEHLSALVRIPSISRIDPSTEDIHPFLEVHTWIANTFPQLSGTLEREVINSYSLLYKWVGSEPALAPVLFNAHIDVVPADADTLNAWNGEPFSGKIENGVIWGRGTLDMKNQLVALLESAERLIADGYTPRRTIYIAFGHDEEIMGFKGSKMIVEHLKTKGEKLAAVLDEGGMITEKMLPGVEDPVGLVGITEKGYLTLSISAEGKPGHSSMPPQQTAIGIIARAIALMDDHPMPARLDHILPTLISIGHLLPFGLQFVIANAWLFKPVLLKQLAKSKQMNAMIRTTHAATMMDAGIKDNVLPSTAEAKVNCRLLPGDTIEDVIGHFSKVIADPRVTIRMDAACGGWGASSVSETETPAYRSLELVIRQVFDNVTVAPFVFLAATDSRHYQPICQHIYKFSPLQTSPESREGVHGINERINVDGLAQMVVFFIRLMRLWGDAEF
jgi:carboxypeptidase PM20D1